jgi:hypothetical protein
VKAALKTIRECQENLVVLDRSHGIKVCGGMAEGVCVWGGGEEQVDE